MSIFNSELKPPYYAVIFSSTRSKGDKGYSNTADVMVKMVSKCDGFLGVESLRNDEGFGITVSYWDSLDSIDNWRHHEEHSHAKIKGKEVWYSEYKIRICKVESDNYFSMN